MEPLKWFTTMRGIGTRDRLDRLTGGAFGWGIDSCPGCLSVHLHELQSWGRGRTIFIWIQPGAYTVRSLAGLMSCSGIVHDQIFAHLKLTRSIIEEWRTAVQEVSSFPWLSPWTCPDNASWLLGYGRSLGPDQVPLLPINELLNRNISFMTLSWARSSSTLFTLLLLMKSARSLMLLKKKESQQWDQRFTKFGFQVSMVVSAVVQGRIAGFQMLHCFGWWIWSLN